jgi:transposase InsO family protein
MSAKEGLLMPWKETCAMEERKRFVNDWLTGDFTKTQLCAAYGISRPTGDKWIDRAMTEGMQALAEHSRAPHRSPNATPAQWVQMIIETKLAHQHFGPKKVLDCLRRRYPRRRWPADSTVGEILKRAGLVRPRRARRRVYPDSEAFAACSGCNDLWSADFKGDFALGDRTRCYPLTLSDNYSRYLLQCQALPRTHAAPVRQWMEWAFREYGLPHCIRTDNGAPFASLAVGGISALSKWWIQLGIRPQRIRPGRPGQNGRHERMHRSLKQACPPQASLAAQQRRFDAFVHEFNWERSHEALDRATPGSHYRASSRAYPAKLPAVEYGDEVTVRYVHPNGEIRWQQRTLYLSQVLAKDHVALKQIDESIWEIRYSFHLLALFNERNYTLMPVKGWHGSNH